MIEDVYHKGQKQVVLVGRLGRAVLAMVVVLLSGTTLLAAADAFQPYGTLKRSLPRTPCWSRSSASCRHSEFHAGQRTQTKSPATSHLKTATCFEGSSRE
jgi:hypothetical protein